MLISDIKFINIKNREKKVIILISINARTLGKFLKRYKSRIKGKQEILKVAQKRSRTCSDLNGIARRVEFKELITNKTNQL